MSTNSIINENGTITLDKAEWVDLVYDGAEFHLQAAAISVALDDEYGDYDVYAHQDDFGLMMNISGFPDVLRNVVESIVERSGMECDGLQEFADNNNRLVAEYLQEADEGNWQFSELEDLLTDEQREAILGLYGLDEDSDE